MSAKVRGSQSKQRTINAFFKTASEVAPGRSTKLADDAPGQGPADDDDTRPAKRCRLGDANTGKPSSKHDVIHSAVAATKSGRGVARSKVPKAPASGLMTMDIGNDDGEAVIDLMDTSTTSSDHDLGHRAETRNSPAKDGRLAGDDNDISRALATAGATIASTATPVNTEIKSTTVSKDGNGLRRLMTVRRRSAAVIPNTAAVGGDNVIGGSNAEGVSESPPSVLQANAKLPFALTGTLTNAAEEGGDGGGPGAVRTATVMMTPQQRERARYKLAQEYGRRVGLEPDADAMAAAGRAGAATAAVATTKLTPLEQQVVALKAEHPGTLLVVEVGYKMRFFGEDAETAAQVCNLWAHMEHNFLTASFPVYRLPVYVRRLCRAGYRVGVVRQTETAAIKAAGANKSAPFERKVTGLYTAATLEAGRRADKIGEEDTLEEFRDAVPLQPGGAANVLVLAELPPSPEARKSQQQGKHLIGNDSGVLGVLCLDVAGGDIVYGVCGNDEGVSEGGDLGGAAAGSAHRRLAAAAAEDLEALLIAAAPVEIVTVGPPLRTATKRLLMNYLSSAPACRLEHLPPPRSISSDESCGDISAPCQQQKQQQQQEVRAEDAVVNGRQRQQQRRQSPGGKAAAGKGGKRGGARGRVARTTEIETEAGAEVGVTAGPEEAAGAVAGGTGGDDASGAGGCDLAASWLAVARQELVAFFAEDTAATQTDRCRTLAGFTATLPPAVELATWGALRHLQPFGLTAVLRVRRCWRPLRHCTAATSFPAPVAHGTATAAATPLLQEMTLGPNALRQLEIVSAAESGSGGRADGTGNLLGLMDRTHTAFGSRLLRRWLVRPLCQRDLIIRRQEAVSELLEAAQGGTAPLCHVAKALSRLTDVERGVTRALHGTSSPSEFVATVRALQQLRTDLGLQPLPDPPENLPYDEDGSAGGDGDGNIDSAGSTAALSSLACRVRSPLLRLLLRQLASQGLAAALAAALQPLDVRAAAANDFGAMFMDRERFPGVWAAKDAVRAEEDNLQSLQPSLARAVGLPNLSYVNIQNQGNFLVEVPVEVEKRVPRTWHKVCSTKKVHRYHPPDVTAGLQALGIARERLAAAQSSAWTLFLTAFTPTYPLALAAVRAAAQLDVLAALAALAATPGYCRPVFLADTTGEEGRRPQQADQPTSPPTLATAAGPALTAVLRARDARHPMLDARLSGAMPAKGTGGPCGAVVPNDVDLDARGGGCRCLIVTGPNMGGKSCYTRTAALLVVMAQVGSYVPAASLELTVFDGVYTRMGASDNILLGRSTFFEEMSDAAGLLAAATPRSLVVLDELGRGTATHDGVAVAEAVLHYLLAASGCLVLFVTHYPQLAEAVRSWPGVVKACHMSYLREDGNLGEPEDVEGRAEDGAEIADAVEVATVMEVVRAGDGSDGDGDGDGSSRDIVPIRQSASGPGYVPRITFLYKLCESAADESFGLNVAQMAGLPLSVLCRAAEMARRMRQLQERAAVTEVELIPGQVLYPPTVELSGPTVEELRHVLPEHVKKEVVLKLPGDVDAVRVRQELLSFTHKVAGVVKSVHGGGGDHSGGNGTSAAVDDGAVAVAAAAAVDEEELLAARDELMQLQMDALQMGCGSC